MKKTICLMAALAAATLMGGCATKPAPYDYSAFQRARPASLLVLPPVNDSPEIKATSGVWAHATQPLAEAGYYVFPAALVDETFAQNGLTSALEIQAVPYAKLHDYFGADAAVYLHVKRYGTSYAILGSETRVEVDGRIVDLRTGELLWQGSAVASSNEQQQQNQGGIVGLLVVAIVKQIIGTTTDAAFNYAAVANARLMGAPRFNGILPGPRSPHYGEPPVEK